ncbi:hypothetical protein [Nodularia chucula]|uniref:hypothetical protein n=1 Tax=Nodularia chucula TaxID=3093667 RepID=UPI0039C6C5DB
MTGMDFKNLVEIAILVAYAIAIIYKLASVESTLKHLIATNSSRLDLSIANEVGKLGVLERDIQNLKNAIAELSQSQKELQSQVFGREYPYRA